MTTWNVLSSAAGGSSGSFPWLLAFIPLASVGAGLLGEVLTPSSRTSTLLIYASAGVLIVALAVDLLPPLLALSLPGDWLAALAAVGGLVVGTGIMVLVRDREESLLARSGRPRSGDERTPRYPLTAVTAIYSAMLVDGVVASLTAGIMGGASIPLTLALGLNDAAGTLALVERMRLEGVPAPERLATVAGVGAVIAFGLWLGWGAKNFLRPRSPETVGVFSLAIAVVTWLIFEELVVQVSRVPDASVAGQASLIAGLLVATSLQWIVPKQVAPAL